MHGSRFFFLPYFSAPSNTRYLVIAVAGYLVAMAFSDLLFIRGTRSGVYPEVITVLMAALGPEG
jgi:hypothetical protein